MLHEVGDDHRDLLLRALGLRVVGEVLALGGEAHAEGRVRQRRDLREDVLGGLELDLERLVGFLELAGRGRDRRVVGHRRDAEEVIHVGDVRLHGIEHLRRGRHVHEVHLRRRGEGRGSAHERDIGAEHRGGFGDRVTHLAGA